jgi:hypothetical protein
MFVYPVAGASERARTAGASGELSSGADLISGRRPPFVDGRNICAVVRGIQGTAQERVMYVSRDRVLLDPP